jgi:NADH dehydrogenase
VEPAPFPWGDRGCGLTQRVVIVGGGFAGLACAKHLATDKDVQVTLIDRLNYSQFQPLLYQVATAQLGSSDVASPLRTLSIKHPNVSVKLGEVASVDPGAHSVTTSAGQTYTGDYLVLAGGSQPNFFGTPGASELAFPLYSLTDAQRLRSRIIGAFEEADRDPALIDQGALTFVIVGAGATGTEIAGALSEMIHGTLAAEYRDLAVTSARVVMVDHGHAVLGPFSEAAHDYAAKVLQKDGVQLRLGTGVTEVGAGHVTLSDGTTLRTRCVIWGGGLKAAPVAAAGGLPQGRGGRIRVGPDLTVDGFPGVYVVGDIANIPSPSGDPFPQLGSVAQQSGKWAASNILDDIAGKPRKPFHYLDKGVMAMIGRNSAVAEVGKGHHTLHGSIAFAAWLGVHAALMSGFRNRIDAFVDWSWDYFSKSRSGQVLDRSDSARIDWDEDPETDDPPANDETAAFAPA